MMEELPYIRLDDGSIVVIIPDYADIEEKHGVVVLTYRNKVMLPKMKMIGVGRRHPIWWVGDVVEKFDGLLHPVPTPRCKRCGITMMVKKYEMVVPYKDVVDINDVALFGLREGKLMKIKVMHIEPRHGNGVKIERDAIGDVISTEENIVNYGTMVVSTSPIVVAVKKGVSAPIEAEYIMLSPIKIDSGEKNYRMLYGILFVDSFDDVHL